MTTLNATEARTKLYALIDETSTSHQPIVITGRRGNAVLLAEEDWNAICETLHLLAVPGMRESIREGMGIGFDECDQELDWCLEALLHQASSKGCPQTCLIRA